MQRTCSQSNANKTYRPTNFYLTTAFQWIIEYNIYKANVTLRLQRPDFFPLPCFRFVHEYFNIWSRDCRFSAWTRPPFPSGSSVEDDCSAPRRWSSRTPLAPGSSELCSAPADPAAWQPPPNSSRPSRVPIDRWSNETVPISSPRPCCTTFFNERHYQWTIFRPRNRAANEFV